MAEIITPEILEGMGTDEQFAVLNGIDSENQAALLLGIGRIAVSNPQRAQKLAMKYNAAIKAGAIKAASPGYPSARAEALNRVALLPEKYRKALAEKRARLMDKVHFQTKRSNAATGTIKVFSTGDQKSSTGGGNILGTVAQAKLDSEKPFLVTAIQILSGGDGGTNDVTAVTFGIADKAIINGFVQVRHDGKEYLKDFAGTAADTTNRQDRQIGTFILDNPFWIMPDVEFSVDLELAGASAANLWVKVALYGAEVIPA